jgi:ribosome assembly protein 1
MRPPVNKELGRGVVVGVTSSKQVTVTLRVRPLPADVTEFLIKHSGSIKRLYAEKNAAEETDGDNEAAIDEAVRADTDITETKLLSTEELKKGFQALLENGKGKESFKNIADRITSFGPRRTGPNLLIDATKDQFFAKAFALDKHREASVPSLDAALQPGHFVDKITYGFQLATDQGPLCNEPVQGIAVFVEDVSITAGEDESVSAKDRVGRLTGEVIKTVQQSVHKGFLDWSPRLMLAMYSCEIQASSKSSSIIPSLQLCY